MKRTLRVKRGLKVEPNVGALFLEIPFFCHFSGQLHDNIFWHAIHNAEEAFALDGNLGVVRAVPAYGPIISNTGNGGFDSSAYGGIQ